MALIVSELVTLVSKHPNITDPAKAAFKVLVRQPSTANELRSKLDLSAYHRPDMAMKHILDELFEFGLIQRTEKRKCTVGRCASWEWTLTGRPPSAVRVRARVPKNRLTMIHLTHGKLLQKTIEVEEPTGKASKVAEVTSKAAEAEIAQLKAEIERYRTRLQFDPGGSDKIDELEQAMALLRHDLETAKEERDKALAERDRALEPVIKEPPAEEVAAPPEEEEEDEDEDEDEDEEDEEDEDDEEVIQVKKSKEPPSQDDIQAAASYLLGVRLALCSGHPFPPAPSVDVDNVLAHLMK